MHTPRRTDARRNREMILRAAEEAFAHGPEVSSLAQIARRAGLGRATVYRHFPDRHALAGAVARRRLAEWKRIVETGEDGRTFRDLLHEVLCEQVARRPLVTLFRELSTPEQQEYIGALIEVLTPAFRRAQAAGQLRADVEPGDIARIVEMVEAVVTSPLIPAGGAAAARKFIAVTLDGLCLPDDPAPPGRPASGARDSAPQPGNARPEAAAGPGAHDRPARPAGAEPPRASPPRAGRSGEEPLTSSA